MHIFGSAQVGSAETLDGKSREISYTPVRRRHLPPVTYWAQHGNIYVHDKANKAPKPLTVPEMKFRMQEMYEALRGFSASSTKGAIHPEDLRNFRKFMAGCEELLKIAIRQGDQRTPEVCLENVRRAKRTFVLGGSTFGSAKK